MALKTVLTLALLATLAAAEDALPTCTGDKSKCATVWAGKCDNADIGELVQTACPEMCGKCETLAQKRRRSECGAASITTAGGGLTLKAKSGKDVCFEDCDGVKTCVQDMALQEDMVKAENATAATLAALKDLLMTTVDNVEAEASKNISKLQKTVYAEFKTQLDELRANDCGRHCEPGFFVSTPCRKKPDGNIQKTVCSKCADGKTFSDGGLQRKCDTCTSCAAVHAYKTGSCKFDTDTQCKACNECSKGTFAKSVCKTGGTGHCQKHKTCGIGEFMVAPGTSKTDTVCKKCSGCLAGLQFMAGKCGGTKDTVCKTCAACKSSEVETQKCSADKDRKCVVPTDCSQLPAGSGFKAMTFKWGKAFCMAHTRAGVTGTDNRGWTLAMNIHPNDGHNAAWSADPSPSKKMSCGGRYYWAINKCGWWTCDSNYEPRGHTTPFGKDYKSQSVAKNKKVEEIMIMRHVGGKPHMWMSWKIQAKYKGKTMLWLYQNTYRTQITDNYEVKKDLMGRTGNDVNYDPIFAFKGALIMNLYYSNNGARLAMGGAGRGYSNGRQRNSNENENDDATYGLGMEFASHQGNRRYSGSSGDWCFDVSWNGRGNGNTPSRAGCPSNRCGQGKDKCRNLLCSDSAWLGEYSIWVR